MQLLLSDNLRSWIDMYVNSAVAPPHVYGMQNGQRRELTGNGLRKCALFVSSVLMPIVVEGRPRGRDIRLCQTVHLTVDGLEKDLLEWSGWRDKLETEDYLTGDVVIYERARTVGPHATRHVGIVYDTIDYKSLDVINVASTDPERRGIPTYHRVDDLPYTDTVRPVERVLRHPVLGGQAATEVSLVV